MKRPVRTIAAVLLVILGVLVVLPQSGGFLIVSDPLAPADALLPLGGGQERVVYAAEIYNQGYARWFIATNMPLNVPGVRESYGELVAREAVWGGVPKDRIEIAPELVTTTHQEALAVRRLAEREGWRSLLIVTSSYHTRRARLTFANVFRDSGIAISVQPVANDWYRADAWWKTQDGLRETWTEYLKFGLFVVGYR